MQTDKIQVNSRGEGAKEAQEQTDKFCSYVGLNEKDSLRMQLLCEETLGMVRAIAGDFEAEYWIESLPEKNCVIHLLAATRMDRKKRRELIQTSSDNKNAAASGFMGKVRDILEKSLYTVGELGKVPDDIEGVPGMFYYEGLGMSDNLDAGPVSYLWSLERYKTNVSNVRTKDERAKEAWDEMEKSIVANIADDVRVYVKGGKVELEIEKKFA